MRIIRPAQLAAAAAFAAVVTIPGAAFAQDCVADGPGSSVGEPEECEFEPEVLGEVVERQPLPAPEPETAPELAKTGSRSGDLAIAAAAALGAGSALVVASRRRRVEA